jgi:hypothetical protein
MLIAYNQILPNFAFLGVKLKFRYIAMHMGIELGGRMPPVEF